MPKILARISWCPRKFTHNLYLSRQGCLYLPIVVVNLWPKCSNNSWNCNKTCKVEEQGTPAMEMLRSMRCPTKYWLHIHLALTNILFSKSTFNQLAIKLYGIKFENQALMRAISIICMVPVRYSVAYLVDRLGHRNIPFVLVAIFAIILAFSTIAVGISFEYGGNNPQVISIKSFAHSKVVANMLSTGPKYLVSLFLSRLESPHFLKL